MSKPESEWVGAMALYHRLWTSETEVIRTIQEKIKQCDIDRLDGQVEFAAGAMEYADWLAEVRENKLSAARVAVRLRRKVPAFQPKPPAPP